jgi:hypothetical protein
MTSFNSQRQGNCGISWSGTIGTLLVQILDLLALVFAVVRYHLEWSSETNQAEFMSATKPSASIPIIPANFQLRFRPSMLEPVAIGMLELLQEPPFTLCGTRQHPGRASLQDLIFECRAFGIVLLEPFVRGDRIGKHLEMIGVANMVFGIYVNPNGRHRPAC